MRKLLKCTSILAILGTFMAPAGCGFPDYVFKPKKGLIADTGVDDSGPTQDATVDVGGQGTPDSADDADARVDTSVGDSAARADGTDGASDALDGAELGLDGGDADTAVDVGPDVPVETSSCTDRKKNGVETDVDCGGKNHCSRCALGYRCASGDDCDSNWCLSGRCSAVTCSDQKLNGGETDTDCGGAVCPPCTTGRLCRGDVDCVDEICRTVGSELRCIAPACDDGVKNGEETAKDCGGPCAMGASPKRCTVGQTCREGNDCDTGICSDTGFCQPPKCADGVKNAEETDKDCGGGECGPCHDGQTCLAARDCVNKVCSGTGPLTCQVPSCEDGIQNGKETYTDCGGDDCRATKKCGDGKGCVQGADCVSLKCNGSICAPADCFDDLRNGDETSTDCGGSCARKCPTNEACLKGADCESGVCSPAMACAAPTCPDGVRNQDETDVDCGGSACATRCDRGRACRDATDCISGLACDGGVCAPPLQVLYSTRITTDATRTIQIDLNIKNIGTTAIKASRLRVIYWFTAEAQALGGIVSRCSETISGGISNQWCSFSYLACGSSNTLCPTVTANADSVMVLSFASSIDGNTLRGTIPAGGQWAAVLPLSFDRTTGGNFTQTNDYSFSATPPTGGWTHMGLLLDNTLVWGELPH